MKSLHPHHTLRFLVPVVLLLTLLPAASPVSPCLSAQASPEGEQPSLVGKPAQGPLDAHFIRLTDTSTVQAPTSTQGWAEIMREGFESAFPSTGWELYDLDGMTNGEYYPARRDCVSYTGTYGGWLVGGGAHGATLPCGAYYPNNASAWMIYGPFDLTNATDAKLDFKLLLRAELTYDWFYALAVLPNGDNWGVAFTGDSQGWVHRELYLTQLGPLGNLTGQPEVYIALGFTSDDSVTLPGGAFVDDVVLRTLSGNRAVLFQDDFDDGNAVGWNVIEGIWSVWNDAYVGSGADARSVAGDSTWSDIIYKGRFMFDPSDAWEASVLFRVRDAFPGENNGHYYQIANYAFFNLYWGGNVALHRITGGTIEGLQAVTFLLDSGQWYNFRLDITGDVVKYYIDGALVLSQSGLFEYNQGRIGIKAYYSTSHFDDILVESTDVSPTPPPTPSPLEEALEQFASNSDHHLDLVLQEAHWAAEDGDYFAVQKKEDEIELVADGIIDSVGILADGFEAVAEVKDLTKMQAPGVIGRGWGHVLKLRAQHEAARNAFRRALMLPVSPANASLSRSKVHIPRGTTSASMKETTP